MTDKVVTAGLRRDHCMYRKGPYSKLMWDREYVYSQTHLGNMYLEGYTKFIILIRGTYVLLVPVDIAYITE